MTNADKIMTNDPRYKNTRPPCDTCGAAGDVKPDDWTVLCAGCYLKQQGAKISLDDRGGAYYPEHTNSMKRKPRHEKSRY